MKKLVAKDNNGLYGLISTEGEVILDAIYEDIMPSDDDFIAVKQYGKWGFLNSDLSWAINPQFAAVKHFSKGGVAPVKRGEKPGSWGLINRQGDSIPLPYDYGYYSISEFNDAGLAIAEFYGNYVLIDEEGQHLNNDTRYTKLVWLPEEEIYFGYELGKTIIIDENLNPIITPKKDYDEVYYKCDGLYQVVKDELVGYMDGTGREVIPCQFPLAYEYSIDGLAPAQTKDEKFGFINRNGQFVIEPIYEDASCFNFGIAPVTKDGETYFIDIHGEPVFKEVYADANGFTDNGLAYVKFKDGTAGFITTQGELAFTVDPEWKFNYGFISREDLITYQKGDKYGLLDNQGNIVCEAAFDSLALSVHSDLHCFKSGNRYGYVSSQGKIIIPNVFRKASPFGSTGKAPVITDDYSDPDDDTIYVAILHSDGSLKPFSTTKVITDIGGSVDSPMIWAKDMDEEFFYLNIDQVAEHGFVNEARPYYKYASPFVEGEAIVDLLTQHILLDKAGKKLPFNLFEKDSEGRRLIVNFPRG